MALGVPVIADWTQSLQRRFAKTGKICCRSGLKGIARHLNIVRSFGGAAVTVRAYDLPAIDQKYTRHLRDVAHHRALTNSAQQSQCKSARPDLPAKHATAPTALQLEGAVDLLSGIAEMDYVAQSVTLKDFGSLFWRTHMHQHDCRTLQLDGLSLLAKVDQGFATEDAAQLSQKYKKQRQLMSQLSYVVAAVAVVRAEYAVNVHEKIAMAASTF